MTYEVNFVDGIEDDFLDLGFTANDLEKVNQRLQAIANHPKPLLLTERVMNTPLRKIPVGNHRLFLYIDESTEAIYCLAIKHHNCCYKQQELKRVLTALKKIAAPSE